MQNKPVNGQVTDEIFQIRLLLCLRHFFQWLSQADLFRTFFSLAGLEYFLLVCHKEILLACRKKILLSCFCCFYKANLICFIRIRKYTCDKNIFYYSLSVLFCLFISRNHYMDISFLFVIFFILCRLCCLILPLIRRLADTIREKCLILQDRHLIIQDRYLFIQDRYLVIQDRYLVTDLEIAALQYVNLFLHRSSLFLSSCHCLIFQAIDMGKFTIPFIGQKPCCFLLP